MTSLRAYRKKHNLTQAEAAARLEVSQEMVAQLEAGTKQPSPELADRLRDLMAGGTRGSSSRGPYLMGRK